MKGKPDYRELGNTFAQLLKKESAVGTQSEKTSINIADIQGNLIGFNKPHQMVLIFVPDLSKPIGIDVIKFLQFRITSAKEVLQFRKLRKTKTGYSIPSNWLNMGISVDTFDNSNAYEPLNIEKFSGFKPKFIFLLGCDDKAELEREAFNLRRMLEDYGEFEFEQMGSRLEGDPSGRGHFGFKDGLAQPKIMGLSKHDITLTKELLESGRLVYPGEFIFGYPTHSKECMDKPASPEYYNQEKWTKDGSLLVFLKIKQNVETYYRFLENTTQELKSSFTELQEISEDWLSSKLMGVHKDGSPLEQPENEDKNGTVCPFAAHVKKANPATNFPKKQIIRRGIPYMNQNATEEDKGLLFLCYQTSVEQQFEYIYKNYLHNPNFPIAETGSDPIMWQSSCQEKGTFTIPIEKNDGSIFNVKIEVPQFVEIVSGGYFFIPSISSIDQVIEKLRSNTDENI